MEDIQASTIQDMLIELFKSGFRQKNLICHVGRETQDRLKLPIAGEFVLQYVFNNPQGATETLARAGFTYVPKENVLEIAHTPHGTKKSLISREATNQIRQIGFDNIWREMVTFLIRIADSTGIKKNQSS